MPQAPIELKKPGLERSSPVPLYHQVVKQLRTEIHAGQFEVHGRFPTERHLIRRFGVSAPTVRQAMTTLVREGYLVRERGRGTFVRPIPARNNERGRAKRHQRIGLVMPWQRDSIFAAIPEATEQVIHDSGMQSVLVNHGEDPAIEMAKLREMIEHGVDGMLWICPTRGSNPSFVKKVLEAVGAIVTIDRVITGDGADKLSRVQADNAGGMVQVVRHLLKSGRRRIALVREPQRCSSLADREYGYVSALREAGIDPDPTLFFSSRRSFRENGRICAEKLARIASDIDAVCCMSDATAVGLLQRLEKLGFRVPDDIAVTGFNDDILASVINPSLTTVRIDMAAMGRRAAHLLMMQLQTRESGKIPLPQCLNLPIELIVRESA